MLNQFREKLEQNQPTVTTRIWSTWPRFIEAAASTGSFDYLEFVAEYSPFTLNDLENFARTCELYHVGSMIKVDFQNRFYVAQKAMAAGFQAVLFTDHKTPEEVRETLNAVTPDCPEYGGRFGYPSGRWIEFHPKLNQMDYARMNKSTVKAFMIEKREAMENLEEICRIPGVDMVQFGPSDYSMSMGWNRNEHQKDLEQVQKTMIETALACGVRPRVEITTVEEAEKYKALGVKDFSILDQMAILMRSWTGECAGVRRVALDEQ